VCDLCHRAPGELHRLACPRRGRLPLPEPEPTPEPEPLDDIAERCRRAVDHVALVDRIFAASRMQP
jgi:hypothetical protein